MRPISSQRHGEPFAGGREALSIAGLTVRSGRRGQAQHCPVPSITFLEPPPIKGEGRPVEQAEGVKLAVRQLVSRCEAEAQEVQRRRYVPVYPEFAFSAPP